MARRTDHRIGDRLAMRVKRAIVRRKNALVERVGTSWLALALYRLRGSPAPVPYRVKRYWIARAANRLGVRTLVETGTYAGGTIAAMLSRFDTIHSIELDPTLHEKARERFANYPKVRLHQGDSAEVLPRLLADLSERCLFWLDGHYSGGQTARGELETPVEKELAAIGEHSRDDHAILIDDARQFTGDGDYPTQEQVIEALKRINPRYDVRIVDDVFQAIVEP